MPVLKSAKKRMKQNAKIRARNFPVRSEMKTLFKRGLVLIKEGKADEAEKLMPKVYSIIDMACKKNIIHKNNAARKKSRLARELNALQAKGGKGAAVAASGDVAAAAEKKAAKEEVEA